MLNGTRRLMDMLLRPGPTRGVSTVQAGVDVETPLDNVAVTTGRDWRNMTRPWRGPVVKQKADCCKATE